MACDLAIERFEQPVTNPMIDEPGDVAPAGCRAPGGDGRPSARQEGAVPAHEVERSAELVGRYHSRNAGLLGFGECHHAQLRGVDSRLKPAGSSQADPAIRVIQERCRRLGIHR